MSKVNVDYTIKDAYKDYKKSSIVDKVTEDIFKKLTYSYNKKIIENVIEKGKSFRIPGKIGEIKIVKFKVPLRLDDKGNLDVNRLRIDHNATWEYWYKLYGTRDRQTILRTTNTKERPKIYHYNEHTGGFAFRWKWDKIDTRLDITTYYAFKPVRNNRLKLKKFVTEEEKSSKMYEYSIPRSQTV